MGTAGYMSPEQVPGQRTDHRTDIFALGAILYEMLSGETSISEADFSRHDERDSKRRSSGHFAGHGKYSASVAAGGASLPGKESKAAISVGIRSGRVLRVPKLNPNAKFVFNSASRRTNGV